MPTLGLQERWEEGALSEMEVGSPGRSCTLGRLKEGESPWPLVCLPFQLVLVPPTGQPAGRPVGKGVWDMSIPWMP